MIPSDPPCRSVKTLVKLCPLMLKVMCLSPPEYLFRCKTCENSSEPMHALCMDGISQGYLKSNSNCFENISEKCVALKPSTKLSKGGPGSTLRPLTGLVRETRPVQILLKAIRGKPLHRTNKSEKDFASSIRMVSEHSIPRTFHSSVSVCGNSRGDVSNDVGDMSVLAHIRSLVTSASILQHFFSDCFHLFVSTFAIIKYVNMWNKVFLIFQTRHILIRLSLLSAGRHRFRITITLTFRMIFSIFQD